MNKYKIPVLAALGITLVTAAYYFVHPLTARARVGNEVIRLDVAVTDEEKQRGLSGRTSLNEDEGMIFTYQHKDRYSFWMKDMKFPIDILWIDGRTIVDIDERVPVATTAGVLPTYQPDVPVNNVLELRAGSIERLGVAVGDTIEILQR